MKNIFLILALFVIIGVGGYFLINKQQPSERANPSMIEETIPALGGIGATGQETDVTVLSQTSTAGDVMGNAKEFTIDGFEFGYDKKTISVKKGDTVKITLTNSGNMMHDWIVDEFDAKTKRITKGQTDIITFVADKAGTFEYYCSVGQHRANGMKGSLVVE